MKKIHLISTPRNLSTALMYSFAQRNDTQVVDEPLYAHYLQESGAQHPARAAIIASQSTDAQVVIENVFLKKMTKSVHFIKNMTHHLEGIDLSFLSSLTNVLYIRNPQQVLASYAKVIEEPSSAAIGMKEQLVLFKYLQQIGTTPIVLDSGELLKNPQHVLTQLCTACAIPFDEKMLQWEAGPRPEDGVWAPYWYTNVHQSIGFAKQKSSSSPLPDKLKSLYEELLPAYQQLFEHSIKAN